MTLPDDDETALAESNARQRRAKADTEWVEEIRTELQEYLDNINDADDTDAAPYPGEQTLIKSIDKDLKILSHNLAVRRGDADRGYIDVPDYHGDNAGSD